MNKLQFAKFIAYIARMVAHGGELADFEIDELDRIISSISSVQSIDQVHALLEAMQQGRKIDAIKAHRALTGYGLKESKDAVEKYWLTPVVNAANN